MESAAAKLQEYETYDMHCQYTQYNQDMYGTCIQLL